MRILVVDDEPLARESLARVLGERSDIETVDMAVDAMEALNRIRDHAYDILLLDIRMPEMSGMQMVDTLRSQGNGVPAIIFVTAFNEYAVAAFERHATDYILKPFSAERVHRAIDYAKQHSAEDRERRLAEILPHLQTAGEIHSEDRDQVEGAHSLYRRSGDRGCRSGRELCAAAAGLGLSSAARADLGAG